MTWSFFFKEYMNCIFHTEDKTLNHLFTTCDMAQEIQNLVKGVCTNIQVSTNLTTTLTWMTQNYPTMQKVDFFSCVISGTKLEVKGRGAGGQGRGAVAREWVTTTEE